MSAEKANMEISNPRRILAVSLTDSAQHLSHVIRDLTGTHPTPAPAPIPEEPETPPSPIENTTTTTTKPPQPPPEEPSTETTTLAGTTHTLALTTPYYTATIPVWLDLVASPTEWAASFLSPEAKEVLDVLGAVVVVFALPLPLPPSSSAGSSSSQSQSQARELARELVAHVGKVVREGLGGWGWDGVGLAVGVAASGTGTGGSGVGAGGDGEELDEWEDLCAEWGLEFVHVSGEEVGKGKGAGGGDDKKRNEFGERMGVARVREALEANDWSGGEIGGGDGEEDEEEGGGGAGKDVDDGEFDPRSLDFGFDREDFVGLRKAIWAGIAEDDGEGSKEQEEDKEVGDEDVQKLERMMMKLQAVKEASAGLPEEQRKRMAARAVGEVMKEL